MRWHESSRSGLRWEIVDAREDACQPVNFRFVSTEILVSLGSSDASRLVPRTRSGRAPVRAVDAVDQCGVAEQLSLAAQRLAQPLGHANRGIVARADEADEMVAAQLGEGVGHRAAGTLGGVAAAPRLASQHPAELEVGPAFGLEEADTAQQPTGRALLHGPQSETAQLPVAED